MYKLADSGQTARYHAIMVGETTHLLFTINGNQENALANPIPYFRTTQGSTWSKGAVRYSAWKQYVQKCFETQNNLKAVVGKPIKLSKTVTATMDIAIEWANEAHADCDNIYKGISDALFDNDKYITCGSFKSCMSKNKRGKVLVQITLHGKHT